MEILNKVKSVFKMALEFLNLHKIVALVVAGVIVLTTVSVVLISSKNTETPNVDIPVIENPDDKTDVSAGTEIPDDKTENGNTTTDPVTDPQPEVVDPNKDKVGNTETHTNSATYPAMVYPPEGTVYNYRYDIDMDNNIFMDSLGYTGYNLEKHRADGLMWTYILSTDKRHRGWLTEIGYDYDGSTSGYETNALGLPDIDYFVKKDLVCASYITYVYFNYIPNVVGTDVSMLCKPQNPKLANDWYKAAKQWVLDGHSVMIPFTARLSGGFIKFEAEKEMPIGSLLFFCDAKNKSDWASHVCIYAGYKNGNHWVYHVGNDNGPEFCSIERMHFGADPQWPIGVIATPTPVISKMK